MSKSALKELPTSKEIARGIAASAHSTAKTFQLHILIPLLTFYRSMAAKMSKGAEPTPEENQQLGSAMIELKYLDEDGSKLASDVELLRRLETGYPPEVREEAKFRVRCEELHKKAQDAVLARTKAIEAANAVHLAAMLAENEQTAFEMSRREYLNLKKHNARMFGSLEEAIDPESPNVGIRVERIRDWQEKHREPGETAPNYLPHVTFKQ